MERMTQAELARHLNVSPAAVSKAVKTSRITPGEDGRFDPLEAEQQWLENTRPSIKPGINRPDKAAQGGRAGQSQYAQARARKETALAAIAELRRKQVEGRLCEVGDVETGSTELGTILRTSLEGLPHKIAGELAFKGPEEIALALSEAIDGVLTEMANKMGALIQKLATPTAL